MGQNRFLIRVASGGCTDKTSFKVDVKKEENGSKKPHYSLTVIRITPDACKALLFEGALVLFDLEKDLGLKGDFTYTVTNRVLSSSIAPRPDESLFSIIEKNFTDAFFPQINEVHPEPYEQFVMDHGYFSCLIPASWKLERDQSGDEEAGIFEIKLKKTDKAKPEDGESYFFPDPLIYVGYYAKNNDQKKTYENFIKDYEELAESRKGSDKSHFSAPVKIDINGIESTEIEYEVYQEIPRGPLFQSEFWLKEKFIIIRAKEGFYVAAYKSPRDFYDKYSAAFDELAKSFKPAK